MYRIQRAAQEDPNPDLNESNLQPIRGATKGSAQERCWGDVLCKPAEAAGGSWASLYQYYPCDYYDIVNISASITRL